MHLILKTIQIRLEVRFATGEPYELGNLRKRIAMRECERARREKCIPFVSINVLEQERLRNVIRLKLIALAS